MRGIELSEKCFFEEFLPTLRRELPGAEAHIAAGLVGGGSECFGFDDDISRDHDFSNGFYVWLTDEDDIKYGVALSRIYRKCAASAEIKSARPRDRGVMTVDEFFMRYTGRRGLPESNLEWLSLPESAICEATNGKIFVDNVGEFSAFRDALKKGMPRDVLQKKLAARAIIMAQSGQYNYKRCISHGELGAARLAVFEFVNAAISMIFLLNGEFAPYYKWSLRAMRGLPELSELSEVLTELLCRSDESASIEAIERVSSAVILKLREKGYSTASGDYLEAHAFSVFDGISDRELRSLHIMEA